MKRIGVALLVAVLGVGGGVVQAASSTTVNSGFKLPDTLMMDGAIGAWTQSGGGSLAQDDQAFQAGFWDVLAPHGTPVVYLSHHAGFPATIGQILGDSLMSMTRSTSIGPAGEPHGPAGRIGRSVTGSLPYIRLSSDKAQAAFDSLGLTAVAAAVPEPASLVLLGTGLCLAARHARRRRKKP